MKSIHSRLLSLALLLSVPFGLGGSCEETVTDEDATEGRDSKQPVPGSEDKGPGDADIP